MTIVKSAKPFSSNVTATLKRLVALLEEDETDEYGILQPSQRAFKLAMRLVIDAYEAMGNNFPKASVSTRKCYGVASFEVGRVREIGLDIQQDSVNHANIVGLP